MSTRRANEHAPGGHEGRGLSVRLERVPTPIGEMLLVTDADGALRALDWVEFEARMHCLLKLHYGEVNVTEAPVAADVRRALLAYFAGDLAALDGIVVATAGTEFQRDVWRALRAIPVGETTTYGELARSIARPRAVRAVGAANGKNPIGVVVPCHRVIGANASLTGYAGGIDRKRWLLDHERAS